MVTMVWIWGAKVSQSNVLNSPWLGSSQYVCNFIYIYIYWVPFCTSTHVSCCSFFKHWNRTIPRGDAWSFFPIPTKVGPCVGWHEMCRSGLASVASCWFVGGTQCLDGWTLLLISDDFQFVSYQWYLNNALTTPFVAHFHVIPMIHCFFLRNWCHQANLMQRSHPIIQNHVGILQSKARLALRQVEGEEEPSAPQTSPNHSCWSWTFCGSCLLLSLQRIFRHHDITTKGHWVFA